LEHDLAHSSIVIPIVSEEVTPLRARVVLSTKQPWYANEDEVGMEGVDEDAVDEAVLLALVDEAIVNDEVVADVDVEFAPKGVQVPPMLLLSLKLSEYDPTTKSNLVFWVCAELSS
jgi:hypothetical protein